MKPNPVIVRQVIARKVIVRQLIVRQVIALAMGCCCQAACAAPWFSWTDAQGRPQTSRDKPPLGVPYTETSAPDPVRWSSPSPMPDALGPMPDASVQGLFRASSVSVYWVLRRPASGGSGTVYGSAVAVSDELAITNCHVVAGAGADGELVIGDGRSGETSAAELVAANFDADRCVVRAQRLRLQPVAGLRRFDSLEVGETVYAIGNPQRLERTLSEGLISGKRSVGERRLLQTTAPISPGSSGGGLFDRQGNLVGITTSTLRGAQSVNFAIPAEDFWR